jgi:diguanylate cyclase (GGDEF)-like protein
VRRTLLVPAVVLILGTAAISTTTLLARHAAVGRTAELRLATLKTALFSLQSAPFAARASTGGSPAVAALAMRSDKQQIAGALAQLAQTSPPDPVRQLPRALQANYVPLDAIYRLGTSPAGYGAAADRQAAIAGRTLAPALALIDQAHAAYSARTQNTADEARFGDIGVIVALIAAFLFLFRQNDRLLRTSRREALSDVLTGLPNRRALMRDLEAALPTAGPDASLTLALFDLDGFKRYNDTFGHPAGDALLARLGEAIARTSAGRGTAYRIGGDEFCLLAPGDAAATAVLLRDCTGALSESGDTFNITCSHGLAAVPSEAANAEAALRLADQRLYEEKAGRRQANREIINVLRTIMSERSAGLDQHLTTVARLARLTAQELGLSNDEADRLQLAASLHDVGKTAMPDSLLNKPGPLDADEWKFMRTHTLIGERIILAAPSLAHAAPLVRSSHERIDGTGYPDGLKGEAIPLGSRVIAVCDAYDAMTCDRPYRLAMTPAEALDELRRGSGTQFDPPVVEAFCELIVASPAQHARAA